MALTDDAGEVVEAYDYDPYGKWQVFSAGGADSTWFTNDDTIADDASCQYGHQGLLHDEESGLIYNRARMLHPVLGRFVQRDPIGHVDGMNPYEYEHGNTASLEDPLGLFISAPIAPPVAPPVAPPPAPPQVLPVGPVLVIGGCVYIIVKLGEFHKAYCDTKYTAKKCYIDFSKPIPGMGKKCKDLIGSGGCKGNPPMKRCTYLCDDGSQLDDYIPCASKKDDPKCPEEKSS
jgi:RHS repeat-associated protein